MRCFDDFDAWGDAVSGANLRLVCDAVHTPRWTLAAADLGGVVLQVAHEGGGNICYGGNTHPGVLLFLPLSHAGRHVVNGNPLDEDSLFVIPRGADFRIHVRRQAHSWCSVALPFDGPAATASITRDPRPVRRLISLVNDIATNLLGHPRFTAAHQAAGRALIAAATACLPGSRDHDRRALGRPRLDRAEIIRRAMAAVEPATVLPSATDLAAAAGVTSRTLLRAFQESFGVSPKRYLILRELHLVRRALLARGPDDVTVADVLTRHGIWEFGRFADRYRRQFGELPSETLRRSRA